MEKYPAKDSGLSISIREIHGYQFFSGQAFGLATSLGQQLAFRFKPIGLIVTGQSKSAAAFGNEIGTKAHGVL